MPGMAATSGEQGEGAANEAGVEGLRLRVVCGFRIKCKRPGDAWCSRMSRERGRCGRMGCLARPSARFAEIAPPAQTTVHVYLDRI